MQPKATVIIAFYNKVRFLELVLAGFSRQTETQFEIIIADDGSNPESVAEVKKLISESDLSIKHLWQEDSGFRKNIMLNKSIMESTSDIMIFVDGDCIPHSYFVEEHIKSTRPGVCSAGRRVHLSAQFSDSLTAESVKSGVCEWSNIRYFYEALAKKSNHAGQGIYVKSEFIRRIINKKSRGILGSNFSVHKKDLLDINGFDERYVHPAVGEDTDIEFRLRLKGVEIKSLVNVANQYHLYHKEIARNQINFELYDQVKKDNLYFTPYGIQAKASDK